MIKKIMLVKNFLLMIIELRKDFKFSKLVLFLLKKKNNFLHNLFFIC